MKKLTQNEFDQSTLEAMMERYRAELLRYQRATPPGRPTLEQTLQTAAVEPPPRPAAPLDFMPNAEEDFPDPPADRLLPEEDIWEQPAVFVGEPQPDERIMLSPIEPQDEPQPPETFIAPIAMELPQPMAAPMAEPLPELPQTVLPETAALPLALPEPPVSQPRAASPRCSCHTEGEKCAVVYGSFAPYRPWGEYCRASFLRHPAAQTEVLARFGCDLADGDAETRRCRRSFSVRFFCEDGLYDMFGSFLPVAAGADDQTLAGLSAAMRPDEVSGLRSNAALWRFAAQHPQSLSAVIRLYTDMGTIAGYRMADGFSLPVIWQNQNGEKRLVRTRWLSHRRPRMLSRFEAEELAGADPDFLSRDLAEAIKNGEKVQFELAAQIMPLSQAESCGFDPLDVTCEWPEYKFPLQKLGLLTLDRMPQNFKRETADLRLDAANLIDGIEHPALHASADLSPAANYLRSMGEIDRRTLLSNMAEELRQLPADLLEQVLILFTNVDLEFGRALTAMLGGV